MSSKRQQTMAKMARERAVKERRARKQEKKRERKLAAAAEIRKSLVIVYVIGVFVLVPLVGILILQ